MLSQRLRKPYVVGTRVVRRRLPVALTLIAGSFALLFAGMLARDLLLAYGTDSWNHYAGVDYRLYMDAARDWLSGNSFYLDRQLHGPYVVMPGDRLYPPPALLLFVPFSVLPAVAWWAIPLGTIGWVVWRHHPAIVAWPLIAFCAWWPTTSLKILTGNPVMWAAAAMALGTMYRWPSVLAALKLTLAPFALFGIRHGSWWRALAVLIVVSALFLPLWPDYLRALLDARDPDGPLYSFGEIPFLLLPLAAWAGRRALPDARAQLETGPREP